MSEVYKNRKVLLSLKDVDVKFNVRGRTLQAIRNVSLDIYEHEALAIVGESGSGKSVLTKTFAGMLDSNGYVSHGSIVFADDELSDTHVSIAGRLGKTYDKMLDFLNKTTTLERGAAEYIAYKQKNNEIVAAKAISAEEAEQYAKDIKALEDDIIDKRNFLWTLDKKNKSDALDIERVTKEIEELNKKKKARVDQYMQLRKQRMADYKKDTAKSAADKKELDDLMAARNEKIKIEEESGTPYGISAAKVERNKLLAYEVLLSIGRYPYKDQVIFLSKLKKKFKLAMSIAADLTDPTVLNGIYDDVTFRVEYRGYHEDTKVIDGYAIIDCAKVKFTKDWQQIRGCRIATVFQDPMTSLNPVITIGKQIMTVILKHQKCTAAEARERTIDIMGKVGIPNPEKRFDDYPFEYSGGMRQRIVIAIALSCQPKILICDEPTTALDVTIQAQILRLIKDLQKELGFTTVYITHDLGVVANVAERVAVLYGGQIVEVGMVDEIFYDPKHPYTWALLSSLPQLAERGTELFSIPGTPPSLYNKIVGDAFAPRNQYAMAIDLVKEPPVFKITDTHYAKTWLLDERSPKVETPAGIQNLHEKMLKSYVNLGE